MNKPKKVVVKILDNEQCKKLLHRQENEICSLTDNKKSHLSNVNTFINLNKIISGAKKM